MCLFGLSMSISPGPVNMITFAQGLNYGFGRALPFVGGAASGFALLLLVVGMGLGELIALNPLLLNLMTIAGTAFICESTSSCGASRILARISSLTCQQLKSS